MLERFASLRIMTAQGKRGDEARTREGSKYPPAKPGALRLGPLKGAKFRTFDDVPGIDGRRGTEDPLCRHCITACEGPTRAQNVWARLQESVFVI